VVRSIRILAVMPVVYTILKRKGSQGQSNHTRIVQCGWDEISASDLGNAKVESFSTSIDSRLGKFTRSMKEVRLHAM
jgi:hypothetical protein